MFGSWSAKKELYVHSMPSPIVREASKMFCIKLVVDPDIGQLVPTKSTEYPFEGIVTEKDPHEKAIVVGLYLKYLQSDFTEGDVEVTFRNIFTPSNPNALGHDEVGIESGTYKIPCPPNFNDTVPHDKSLIYKPTVLRLDALRKFGGMEEKIYKSDMVELDMDTDQEEEEEEVRGDDDENNNNNNNIEQRCSSSLVKKTNLFRDTHPIVHFIFSKEKELNVKSSQMKLEVIDGVQYYRIALDLLNTVHRYLDHMVFPRIHYTRFEQTKVTCNLKNLQFNPKNQKSIVLVMQVNCLVVNTNV